MVPSINASHATLPHLATQGNVLKKPQSPEAHHQPRYLAVDSEANVDRVLPKTSHGTHRRFQEEQYLEVDAEAHISHLAKSLDALSPHERHDPVNGDLKSSAALLVRRERSVSKAHLSTDQQPEVVAVTPAPVAAVIRSERSVSQVSNAHLSSNQQPKAVAVTPAPAAAAVRTERSVSEAEVVAVTPSPATTAVRRERSVSKVHLPTYQLPEAVTVTPAPATATAAALHLLVAAPALNELAPASRSVSESQGLLISLIFVLLLLLVMGATVLLLFALKHYVNDPRVGFVNQQFSDVGTSSHRVHHDEDFWAPSADEEEYLPYNPKNQVEHKGRQDMVKDARSSGLLWRLSNAGFSRLPMENAEKLTGYEARDVADMKLWFLRYFNIKVTDHVLTMSYLSEKKDMEPVTMRLCPFKTDGSKFAMEIGAVRTHIDEEERSSVIFDAQQYQVALETSSNPWVLEELPEVLHLFLVNGVRQRPEAKSCPNCGFQLTFHPTHCCGRCCEEPGTHGPRCKMKPMPEKEDEPEPLYQIYGAESRELCREWVSDIQNTAHNTCGDKGKYHRASQHTQIADTKDSMVDSVNLGKYSRPGESKDEDDELPFRPSQSYAV